MKKIRAICAVLLLIGGIAGAYFLLNIKKEQQNERVDVALSFSDTDNPRMAVMLQDILSHAAENHISLKWSDAESNLTKQIEDISELLKCSPKYLVVVPVKTQGLEKILECVNTEKTRIILLDKSIDNFKNIEILAYIGTDALWEGEECARLLSHYFHGEQGEILEIQGEGGSSTNKLHGIGFRNQLTAYPNLELAGVVEGNGDREIARSNVLNFLRGREQRIHAIFASTDEEGMGALAALETLGMAGKIPIVSVNGIQDVKKALMAGVYYGCVEATPYLGEKLFEVILQAENGEAEIQDCIETGTVYSQDTADRMQGY